MIEIRTGNPAEAEDITRILGAGVHPWDYEVVVREHSHVIRYSEDPRWTRMREIITAAGKDGITADAICAQLAGEGQTAPSNLVAAWLDTDRNRQKLLSRRSGNKITYRAWKVGP
jgi:hypothetical protein